jgi:hypothetical protein
MRRRPIVTALVVAGVLVGTLGPVGAASLESDGPVAEPIDQHCLLRVIGQDPLTKELRTAPLECQTGPAVRMRVTYSAVHYTGSNFSGSTLSIVGDTCSGGWLNMPAGWVNVISSTWSFCFVAHWDLNNLTGDVQVLTPPGGNLTSLNNRTNSASYG